MIQNISDWDLPGDYIVMGQDPAYKDDYSVVVVSTRPGRLRRWLRKVGIDKSTWEYKLIDTHTVNSVINAFEQLHTEQPSKESE